MTRSYDIPGQDITEVQSARYETKTYEDDTKGVVAPMERSLLDIASAIEHAEHATSALASRLKPVLEPQHAAVADESMPRAASPAPIIANLDGILTRIQAITAQLVDVNERLVV